MKLTTLKELFEHELQDVYSAEKQIIDVLPRLIEKTTNGELKGALSTHLEQTREHKKKVEAIAEKLDMKAEGVTCRGMQGLIEEGEEILKMTDDPDVRDAAIIMIAQGVEHYEIARYGTLAAHANELGWAEIADDIVEINAQEYETDSNLTDIAESRINADAKEPDDGQLYA
jgi:ferritin-like metal-binding protein YciE